MATYLYRCTEQQLEQHLQRIAETGDAVEHVIYKGGRDYVLVCRKAHDQDSVTAALEAILEEARAIRSLFEVGASHRSVVVFEGVDPVASAAEVSRLSGGGRR